MVAKLLPYPSCELLEVQRAEAGAKALLVPLDLATRCAPSTSRRRRIDVDLAFLGEDA